MDDILLYYFLQDYSIADKTDLNGNKIGGYEIISSGSVGGHMQNMCFNNILSRYGRDKIVKALLEIRKIDEEYYGPDTETNWSKPTDLHDAKLIAIQDIVKQIEKNFGESIVHHENGDSEFTFKVNMIVGASDHHGSSVTIGGLHFTVNEIYSTKNFFVIIDGNGSRIKNSPNFENIHSATRWLINYIKGT